MLKLKELRLSGIGPFVDEQMINFENFGSLIQVDGLRKDTGGSSGSGKTTLFNALDYLLGINDVPNTVLQSYITKDPISVTGTFDFDGTPLVLTRGKGKLSVKLGEEVITGSNKIAEEKLDQIIGMPRSLFRPMVHKRQKEGGFFLNFGPKETHEFLTDLLGLSSFRKKAETVEIKLKEIANEKTQVQSKLASAQSGLQAIQAAMAGLSEPAEQDVTQETILALKQALDAADEALRTVQLDHENQNSILDQKRPSLQRPELVSSPFPDQTLKQAELTKSQIELKLQAIQETERQRVANLNSELQKLTVEAVTLRHKVSAGQSAREEAASLALEIKKVRSGICATCEQSWITEAAKAKEADLMAKVGRLKALIADGEQAARELIANQEAAEAKKVNLSPVVDPSVKGLLLERELLAGTIQEEKSRQAEHHAIQAKQNREILEAHQEKERILSSAFTAEQTALRSKQREEIASAHAAKSSAASFYTSAVEKFRSTQEARKRFSESMDKFKSQESTYAQSASILENQLINLAGDLEVVEEILRALKSYISISFDAALEEISEAATNTIRSIPNMANATIQLEGTKETKEGKIKEEVNAVIHKDGFESIPIKSLSGGERSSVDLAVDLAVIDLLESRTNKGINIFILDEPFNGLDTSSIEQALEILKINNPTRQIILVDHNPIISEFIQDKILVTKDGSSSTISY